MLWLLSFTIALSLVLIACFIRNYYQTNILKKTLAAAEIQLKEQSEKQVTVMRSFDELKEKLHYNILYDALTGLPGRPMFDDRLEQTINQSKRYKLPFAVMCLDLDGFRLINEALGHDVGDELLQEVAKRLQNSIRKVDTISRFGGDEFVVILSQLSKAESVVYVAQRFLNAISQPFKIRDHELYITGSIGVSTFPLDGDDGNTLLKHADNALHQAKVKSRNTFQFYREEMHILSQRELVLNSTLQSQNIFKDFIIYYQPSLNVETKKIICMQALLFWQHPDLGFISQDDFIKTAENGGRTGVIFEWVLRNACYQLKKWLSIDNLSIMSVGVTIIPHQLENLNFVNKISQILQEVQLPPNHLVIEISEKFLLSKTDLVEKALNMLKHLGVQIAIKDYGVGHLSLQQLKHLPLDYVKIASELVRDISLNKDSEMIVKMIIALSKSLQVVVAAEGVSTQKQMTLLNDWGCSIMQGELFSLPMKAIEFTPEKLRSLV